jgi:hypothetical protein
MSDVGDLVAEALKVLDVTDLGPVGAPGGQKVVRRVQLAGDDQVLKVTSLGDSGSEALRMAEREVEPTMWA